MRIHGLGFTLQTGYGNVHYHNRLPQKECCICAGNISSPRPNWPASMESRRRHSATHFERQNEAAGCPGRDAIDGTRYRVLRGSDAHKDMLDILRTLAGQAWA